MMPNCDNKYFPSLERRGSLISFNEVSTRPLSSWFWLCIPPVVYNRHILCLRCLRVALFFLKKKVFFHFFGKKMAWRQVWREVDVRCQTSAPPHLTVWRQTRQLNCQRGTWSKCLHTSEAGVQRHRPSDVVEVETTRVPTLGPNPSYI